MTGSTEILDNQPLAKFLCGVVEGFYGIPWTTEQRKLLFQWMNYMGMTTYMYAPKDDAKHRAFWRDQYSVEEAGLDISFSSAKDVQCLKRKCEQVAAFGCHAFALLFDDIDPELSASDKSAFQSSACAQVSITNELFEHLGQPEFYFCPTEYCTSRAMPNLATSGYLNTVGSKLLNDIHILWTGCKVISKKITISELEEVAKVFRRPPVIWDNIHANDYDQRRMYLGPFDGRSADIIPYLRGVLTNPNCEFEANYIPLHTLGQWSRSNKNGVKKDIITDDDINNFDSKYQPKHALKIAIADWLMELNKSRHPPKSLAVATTPLAPAVPVPNINMPAPIQAYNELETTNLPTTNVNPVDPSMMNPTTSILVNSLVDPLCSPEVSPRRESDNESEISNENEPMDCVPCAISDSINVLENISMVPNIGSADSLMQLDSQPPNASTAEDKKLARVVESVISHEDLELLISFFYLPFEYAAIPVQMLQDLHLMKQNCYLLSSNPSSDNQAQISEWWEASNRFLTTVDRVQNLIAQLKKTANQAVGYYFYPYLWDMVGVLQTCAGFVRWLGMTKDYRDAFLSGDQEPWCFQGGLQAEFQRMLPIASAHDLLYIRHPEAELYNICLKTCDDGADGTEVFPEHPNDEEGLMGYAVAALDAKTLKQREAVAWIPALREKYVKPASLPELTPAEELIQNFHNEPAPVPESVTSSFPSVIRLDVLSNRMEDCAVTKRLLASCLSGLRAQGSTGVYVELSVGDKCMLEHYRLMGFTPVNSSEQDDVVYLGRFL
ncbi:OGA-like protein [Mya arenaria]|uniref:OGA-like protein n=1 Tax=Mya arenaria TaxID=6604 RepID=A0ABY7FJ76_MYAAR|nr:OGA-like protein [Mya arenaria]